MQQAVDTILAARDADPQYRNALNSLDFHVWLFGVVGDLLAPTERAIIHCLAERGELGTPDLCAALNTTERHAGATLTRLRRLKLVWTIRSGLIAYHDLDGWMRVAGPIWMRRYHANEEQKSC